MRDDLTHLIALTIDRSDWITSKKKPRKKALLSSSIFKWRTVIDKMDLQREVRIAFTEKKTAT